MRTLRQHLNSVQSAMSTTHSATKLKEIINATNLSANSYAGLFPIEQLMDKITVNPGDRLPSNLSGITVVRDASDGSRFWKRGEGAAGSDEDIGRYYLGVERAPFSKIGFPFKSGGSIAAGTRRLSCNDMISLATGAYLYVRQVGSTVYNAKVDADGKFIYDADGKLILYAVPSSSFDPQLPGVRFYDSGETNNGEIVFYGENEELAYWSHSTLGWIITDLEDVGASAPAGYFDITDNKGEGVGEWIGLFLSFDSIEESSVESISDDDFSELTVCITNEDYGDFYYRIESVNEDNTFNLSGTHPFDEDESDVTIYREATTRIYFTDYSEEEITSGTYDVYYWTYPNPLTQDDDIIPFAHPDYLELLTIRRLPETRDRRPVSKTELDASRNEAKRIEPNQMPAPQPTTTQGSPFSMGVAPNAAYIARGG